MIKKSKLDRDYGEDAVVWYEKKCRLGMRSLSFTHYICTKDRLHVRTGVFSITEERIDLFRVQDFTFKQTLFGRMFNTGDLILQSNDKTHPTIKLDNVKSPRESWRILEGIIKERRENTPNAYMKID